jgi:exonuclease III
MEVYVLLQSVFVLSVAWLLVFMASIAHHYKILSWNVRGLNNPAKQEDVKQIVSSYRPNLICFQETKMQTVDTTVVRNTLGTDFENNFMFLPANGIRGGILLASRDSVYHLQHPVMSANTITATVNDLGTNATWTITSVYGPQGDLEKRCFHREMKQIKHTALAKWLLIGDFNMIYRHQDKNNNKLERNLMSRFTRALNFLEVKEIELIGRCFTWSNNQGVPTLTRIDRALCTPLWENGHSQPIVQALSSSVSDHCPILLMPLSTPAVKPKFRFETFWAAMLGFQNCVQDAWNEQVPDIYNPLKMLHVKVELLKP